MKKLALLLAPAWLAACAATGPSVPAPAAPAAAPATGAPSESAGATPAAEARLAQAAVTPLSDLNLVRAPIPPVLAAALKAPYAPAAESSCPGLSREVQALDAVLGADLDTPATAANPGLVERGAGAAGDAVVGALRNTAEGVIPFRSWVRKLTGAERYAREVAAAIAAGTVRRAYLKGLGQAAGCPAPAAPRAWSHP